MEEKLVQLLARIEANQGLGKNYYLWRRLKRCRFY